MRDLVTNLLDVAALLLIAAGVGAGSSRWLGWWGLAAAGLVLLAGSQVIDWSGRPAKAPDR